MRIFFARFIFFILLAGFFSAGRMVLAEEIKLRDGTVLRGHIGAMSTDGEYYFRSDDSEEARWISVNDIDSIHFDAVPAAPQSVETNSKETV